MIFRIVRENSATPQSSHTSNTEPQLLCTASIQDRPHADCHPHSNIICPSSSSEYAFPSAQSSYRYLAFGIEQFSIRPLNQAVGHKQFIGRHFR